MDKKKKNQQEERELIDKAFDFMESVIVWILVVAVVWCLVGAYY